MLGHGLTGHIGFTWFLLWSDNVNMSFVYSWRPSINLFRHNQPVNMTNLNGNRRTWIQLFIAYDFIFAVLALWWGSTALASKRLWEASALEQRIVSIRSKPHHKSDIGYVLWMSNLYYPDFSSPGRSNVSDLATSSSRALIVTFTLFRWLFLAIPILRNQMSNCL